MEPELISKKELLEAAGISYGQLYRWKRKNLIPEEWFIRKATFTGQETFFPREKILARIDRIKNMKEDLSLDDLADMFSPNPAGLTLTGGQIKEQNIVSEVVLDLFLQQYPGLGAFSFARILYLYVLEKVLQSGGASLDEGRMILRFLEDQYHTFEGRACELFFLRKLGISTCLLVAAPGEIRFEPGAHVTARISLSDCVEELKTKLFKGATTVPLGII